MNVDRVGTVALCVLTISIETHGPSCHNIYSNQAVNAAPLLLSHYRHSISLTGLRMCTNTHKHCWTLAFESTLYVSIFLIEPSLLPLVADVIKEWEVVSAAVGMGCGY